MPGSINPQPLCVWSKPPAVSCSSCRLIPLTLTHRASLGCFQDPAPQNPAQRDQPWPFYCQYVPLLIVNCYSEPALAAQMESQTTPESVADFNSRMEAKELNRSRAQEDYVDNSTTPSKHSISSDRAKNTLVRMRGKKCGATCNKMAIQALRSQTLILR